MVKNIICSSRCLLCQTLSYIETYLIIKITIINLLIFHYLSHLTSNTTTSKINKYYHSVNEQYHTNAKKDNKVCLSRCPAYHGCAVDGRGQCIIWDPCISCVKSQGSDDDAEK